MGRCRRSRADRDRVLPRDRLTHHRRRRLIPHARPPPA